MRLQGGGMKSVTTAGRYARVIIACGLVLAAAGCGDSIPVGLAGRATGVLQVTVSTSGADLPANGYTVSVDSGAGQPVPVNGKVSLAGLTAGSPTGINRGYEPSWSSDGKRIVFTAEDVFGTPEIFVTNADGSNPTQLTDNLGLWDDFEPAWSPDGTRIAYAERICDENNGVCELHINVMNADGTGKEWVGEGGGPAWSPDGRKIAFSGKAGAISVMCVDRWSDFHVIAPGMWAKVAWSPDGAKIVCDHAECAVCQDIGVMNEDGSGLVWLTPGPGRDFSPTWRPR